MIGGMDESFSEHSDLRRGTCAAAAERVAVSRASLFPWKADHEEVAMQMAGVRALYQIPRQRRMAKTRGEDAAPDWHAQAGLLKFAAPELPGRPSPRRRPCAIELTE